MKIVKTVAFIFGCCICFVSCKEEPIAVPSITSIFPDSAKLGTEVKIEGLNFSSIPGGNKVTINGFPCIILSESPTTIVIKTVPGISDGKIAVTVDRLTAFSEEYKVAPHLFKFSPYEGKPGDEVLFRGVNFPVDTSDVGLYFFDSIKSPLLAYTFFGEDSVSFKTIVPDSASEGNISIAVGPLLIDSDSAYTVIPE